MVKFTLTNGFFEVGEVVACDGVVCEEWWYHVDEVTPELRWGVPVGNRSVGIGHVIAGWEASRVMGEVIRLAGSGMVEYWVICGKE